MLEIITVIKHKPQQEKIEAQNELVSNGANNVDLVKTTFYLRRGCFVNNNRLYFYGFFIHLKENYHFIKLQQLIFVGLMIEARV